MLKNIDFPCLLQKRHQWTDGPIDGRTDRPSYRDARKHLESGFVVDGWMVLIVFIIVLMILVISIVYIIAIVDVPVSSAYLEKPYMTSYITETPL